LKEADRAGVMRQRFSSDHTSGQARKASDLTPLKLQTRKWWRDSFVWLRLYYIHKSAYATEYSIDISSFEP